MKFVGAVFVALFAVSAINAAAINTLDNDVQSVIDCIRRDLLALRYEGDQDLGDYYDQLESVLAGLEEDVQDCYGRDDAYTCTTDVLNQAQAQGSEIVARLIISNPYVGSQASLVIANCMGGAVNFLRAIEPVKTVEIAPIKPLNNNYDGASALECIRRDVLAIRYGNDALTDYFDRFEDIFDAADAEIEECNQNGSDTYQCIGLAISRAQTDLRDVLRDLALTNPAVARDVLEAIRGCVIVFDFEAIKTAEVAPISPINKNNGEATTIECIRRDVLALRYGNQRLEEYFDELESIISAAEEQIEGCQGQDSTNDCTTAAIAEATEEGRRVAYNIARIDPRVAADIISAVANCAGGSRLYY